jgi:hypothetical protein
VAAVELSTTCAGLHRLPLAYPGVGMYAHPTPSDVHPWQPRPMEVCMLLVTACWGAVGSLQLKSSNGAGHVGRNP